ncbi:MAG: hypothetical protein K8F59_07090 [Rhodobacteraceae bacterium]|nr:hypothetical protein [Paracoccaceae bacterium]
MDNTTILRLLRMAAAISLLLLLVNHLLPPKAFAATQLLFDYEFGLIRRGLVGSLLSPLFGEAVSVREILAAAAIISLTGTLAVWRFLRPASDSIAGWLLLILALNSFGFASFTGNSGYLDTLLVALTVLALSLDAGRLPGLLLRLALVALAMLVHENMLPYFTMLLAFDLWLARGRDARALLLAATPVLTGALVLVAMAVLSPITDAAAFAEHLQSKAEFALDPNATIVAGRSVSDNFALMAELRQTPKYWTWVLFDGVPLAAMSLWLIWLAMQVAGRDGNGLMRLFIIGVIAAPLSLNIIAFDVVRFGAASVLVGFMVIVLLLRHLPQARERLEVALSWPHFVVVLVLNANIFTIGVNVGGGHVSQFPWVLLTQLKWLHP